VKSKKANYIVRAKNSKYDEFLAKTLKEAKNFCIKQNSVQGWKRYRTDFEIFDKDLNLVMEIKKSDFVLDRKEFAAWHYKYAKK